MKIYAYTKLARKEKWKISHRIETKKLKNNWITIHKGYNFVCVNEKIMHGK